jgi:multidrug efflux pump subunit AcrB
MTLVRQVRQEFIPPQDQNLIMLNGQMPPGTSLQATSDAAAKIEGILHGIPEVESYLLSIGRGNTVNQFFMPINLTPREGRELTHLDVMDKIRAQLKSIAGLRVSMRDMSSRGLTTGRQYPLSMNLMGPDLRVLNDKAQEIMKKLGDRPRHRLPARHSGAAA